MAVTVLVESESDVEACMFWVLQFEGISAIGSWDESKGIGEVDFYADSIEKFQRIVEYVASWDGERG